MAKKDDIVACTVDTPKWLWRKIRAVATKRSVANRVIWIEAMIEYLGKGKRAQ